MFFKRINTTAKSIRTSACHLLLQLPSVRELLWALLFGNKGLTASAFLGQRSNNPRREKSANPSTCWPQFFPDILKSALQKSRRPTPAEAPLQQPRNPSEPGSSQQAFLGGFAGFCTSLLPNPLQRATAQLPACENRQDTASVSDPSALGEAPADGGFREPGCMATHCPPHLHRHSPVGSRLRSACASLCLSKELEALIKLQQKGNVCSFRPLCQENKGFVLANLWKQPQLPAAFTDCSKGKGK